MMFLLLFSVVQKLNNVTMLWQVLLAVTSLAVIVNKRNKSSSLDSLLQKDKQMSAHGYLLRHERI